MSTDEITRAVEGGSGVTGVSVLMPVGAGADPESVRVAYRSIVDQTVTPEEVVLVTNQRLDGELTAAVENLAAEFEGGRWESFQRADGLGGVLQSGLKACTQPLVVRMDADDVAESNRVREQRRVLTETEASIVGSPLLEFRTDPDRPERVREVPTTHRGIAQQMSWRCPLNHPTVAFDREAVLAVGGYRPFPLMEDWDLWTRCLADGLQFRNLEEPVVRARVERLSDRRRGSEYAAAEIRMALQLRRLGLATPADTLKHLCLRVPVRALPTSVVDAVYERVARSSLERDGRRPE